MLQTLIITSHNQQTCNRSRSIELSSVVGCSPASESTPKLKTVVYSDLSVILRLLRCQDIKSKRIGVDHLRF